MSGGSHSYDVVVVGSSNLDLVATVELSQPSDLLSSGNEARKAYVSFLAPDKTTIATLHFDKLDDANAWVHKHLGVEL